MCPLLTVSLCTDEARRGAVEEGEQAGHGQADVGVGGPQVQRGEPGELNLQDVLRGHLDVGHLRTERRRWSDDHEMQEVDIFCIRVHVFFFLNN